MALNIMRLKEQRTRKGMNQDLLSKKLNVSRSTVAMWEAGRNQPDNDTLVKLAELLDCSVDYLLGIDRDSVELSERFRDRLANIISVRNRSYEDVAEFLDVEPEDIGRMIAGDLDPSYEQFKALARYLNVTEECLEGKTEADIVDPAPAVHFPSSIRFMSDLHRQRVPHIGSVAAGEPIYAPDDLGVYVDSPVDCDAALTVQGDSMAPTYLDGDVIYIKCRPDVPDGTVAVVFLDDEAALKHVYKRPAGLTLVSDNPEYPPRMIEFQEYSNVRIFGVPVGYTRIYKKDPLKKLKKGFK